MGANTMVRYNGGSQVIPDELAEMNLAVERIMGWAPHSITVTQGSRSGSVGASAGTHNGDDAEDLTANQAKAKVKYFRLQGGMFYHRLYMKNVWPEHAHGGRDWSTVGSRGYTAQLAQYHKRLNALANYGPDVDYKMLVFPKHIYKGYIGYVQARSATNAYEQPTTKSKKLNKIVKRQITYVVAEMEVAGSRWYLTLTGKCIRASRFNKIKRPAGATPEKPNVQPKTKPTPAKPKPKPAPAKPPAAPAPTPAKPKPVVPDSVRLNVGTRNVIYRRLTPTGINKPFTNVKKGLAWKDRVKLLAGDVEKHHIHLLATQEAGTYASSAELATACSAAVGSKTYKEVLHGDDAGDITQGVLWRTDVLKLVDEGKFRTEGSDHDWVTWSRLNVVGTEDHVVIGSIHEEWREGGKSAKGNVNDKKRERQFRLASEGLLGVAKKGDVVILAGDFNSSAQNAYDGPGKAAKELGWVDAESAAARQVDTEYDSYHGFENPKNDKQFDRIFFLKEQVDSKKVSVLVFQVDVDPTTKKASDHYQTHAEISIKTKKD